MGYKAITQKQYDHALAAGRKRLSRALRAESVRYDSGNGVVEIKLSNAVTVAVARSAITEWAQVPEKEMHEVRLSPLREAIAVPTHDVEIGVEGLLRDILPDDLFRRAFAHRGGSTKSQAKAEAARANGALGGRRKVVAAGG